MTDFGGFRSLYQSLCVHGTVQVTGLSQSLARNIAQFQFIDVRKKMSSIGSITSAIKIYMPEDVNSSRILSVVIS